MARGGLSKSERFMCALRGRRFKVWRLGFGLSVSGLESRGCGLGGFEVWGFGLRVRARCSGDCRVARQGCHWA